MSNTEEGRVMEVKKYAIQKHVEAALHNVFMGRPEMQAGFLLGFILAQELDGIGQQEIALRAILNERIDRPVEQVFAEIEAALFTSIPEGLLEG